MTHKTTILWGSCPEVGDKGVTYEFDTEGELEAFLMGVDAANGWLDYEEVEEGYVHTDDDD